MAKHSQVEEESELIAIYLPSFGIESWPLKENGVVRKFVRGSVNGVPFEVECDKQVEVAPEVAEVLRPLMAKQAGR